MKEHRIKFKGIKYSESSKEVKEYIKILNRTYEQFMEDNKEEYNEIFRHVAWYGHSPHHTIEEVNGKLKIIIKPQSPENL